MPSVTLDFHDRLSTHNLERVLNHRHPYTKDGWSPAVRAEGLIIDLRKIAYVEPVAAGMVVLLVEACVLAGHRAIVKLPRTVPTAAERSLLDLGEGRPVPEHASKASAVSSYVRRRRDACSALDQLGFAQALRHPHIAELGLLGIVSNEDWGEPIRLDQDASTTVQESSSVTPALPSPDRFQTVAPFRWVRNPDTPDGQEALAHLSGVDVVAGVLHHPSDRVSAADGRTLTDVFMTELAENAVRHGGREYALITAWARRAKDSPGPETGLSCERQYSEWVRAFPIVEIMVGDSGDGVYSTLRGTFDTEVVHLPDYAREWTSEEQVLCWAFNKWSSSTRRRGSGDTRGLYRVERVAHKYDGFVGLRSGRSFVGFDGGPNVGYVRENSRLARMPGTAAYVRLPVRRLEDTPPRLPSLGKPISFRVLTFPEADWTQPPQAASLVCETIKQACLDEAQRESPRAILADLGYAHLPTGRQDGRRVLDELLRSVAEIAHPVAVVLTNLASPGWDACEQSVASVNDRDNPGHDGNAHRADLVLFCHASGRCAWIGGSEDDRALVSQAEVTGLIDESDLKTLFPERETREHTLRDLKEQSHVVEYWPDRGLALRFTPAAVLRQLAAMRSDALEAFVKHIGDSTPDRGRSYWTPALTQVRAIVDVAESLDESRLLGPVAWALAQRCCVKASPQLGRNPVDLLVDSKLDWALVDTFAGALRELLGCRIRKHQVGPGDSPAFWGETSDVVILVDMMYSEDQAQRLASQAMRGLRTPVAVVTVVDARRVPEGDVPLLSHAIPVVSGGTIDLSPRLDEMKTAEGFISPVDSREEMPTVDLREQAEFDRHRLSEMIQTRQAMYSAHILRPNGRHFCFYLDALSLLSEAVPTSELFVNEDGELIIREFGRLMSEWTGDDHAIPSIIWYPLSERPAAAETIARVLSRKLGIPAEPISRAGEAAHPHFPSTVMTSFADEWPTDAIETENNQISLFSHRKSQNGPMAVVVDWGCMTGRSIRDLLRLAIGAGARNVLVAVFLNQLTPEEERYFHDLSGMEFGAKTQAKVEVRFISRLPIQAYDPLSCPHCRQLARLEEEKRRYDPSFLSLFGVDRITERLRPRSLEEMRENPQETMLNQVGEEGLDHALDAEQITALLDLRELIQKAAYSTIARKKLKDRLDSILSGIRTRGQLSMVERDTMMALLAAEWPWLEQEPLSLRELRNSVAQLAVSTASDERSAPSTRRDAIVVLRTSSKKLFAKHLGNLFALLWRQQDVVEQLLYCTLTYLDRDYLVPQSIVLLKDPLDECSQLLRRQTVSDVPFGLARATSTLAIMARHRCAEALPGTQDARSAWVQLRRKLVQNYHTHHPAADSLETALRFGFLEETPESRVTLANEHWTQHREMWEQNGARLLDEVIPLLEAARPLMFELMDAYLPKDFDDIRNCSALDIQVRMGTLLASLDRFASDPAGVVDPANWSGFAQARDWLSDRLLRPSREGGNPNDPNSGSALCRALRDCPCSADQALRLASQQSQIRLAADVLIELQADRGQWVFCHLSLLRDCVCELILNAVKHNAPKPVQVYIGLDPQDGQVSLYVLNGGEPDPPHVPGKGLITWGQRLAPYGGRVSALPLEDCPKHLLEEAGAQCPSVAAWTHCTQVQLMGVD